ncbi:hypothetical protein FWF48_02290 [Candidatus Saccharibacteria bacterium]|nr:hypothetical protein [Candidatus Saccharibacteria bacterium]
MRRIKIITAGIGAVSLLAASAALVASPTHAADCGSTITGSGTPPTASCDQTINVTIGSTITLNVTDATVTMSPTLGGPVVTGAPQTATVSTNNASGYTLTLSMISGAASNSLISGSNSIPAGSGTFTTPATLTPSSWGYRLNSFATDTYAAVPLYATPQKIGESTDPVAADATVVTYGTTVSASQASGTYTNKVTYTAVANS